MKLIKTFIILLTIPSAILLWRHPSPWTVFLFSFFATGTLFILQSDHSTPP